MIAESLPRSRLGQGREWFLRTIAISYDCSSKSRYSISWGVDGDAASPVQEWIYRIREGVSGVAVAHAVHAMQMPVSIVEGIVRSPRW